MYDFKRLTLPDRALAQDLFTLMAGVFEEPSIVLPDRYLEQVLTDSTIWVLAAFVDTTLVGGLVAHSLPMTRFAHSELLIYDLAVLETHQRQGIGAGLIAYAREIAAEHGMDNVFVMVDNEDQHALDFYNKQGGEAMRTTMFTFELALLNKQTRD
jgi:aminoglycoside 3-N-acetyltransferase I